VILEPLQNAGGCIPPQEGYFQRVREICDEFGVLLISDEVICSWGRLGHFFGCERYGYQPDMITTAKALTGAYVPMGACIVSDEVFEPFGTGHASLVHGSTFGGHPVAAAVALRNIQVFEDEDLCGHVRAKEGEFRGMLEELRDIPIVGDVRGAGFFHALELVKDRDTKESFDDEESEWLLRDFLSGELYKNGLICRADDRGDPVIQLAPPLVCDTEQFEEIVGVNIHHVLVYPGLSVQSPLQQLRAVRPLGVDRTLTEIWHFRLKGAPEAIYRRSLAYYNLVNSPATMINADDLENFWKCHQGLASDGGDWVSFHRHYGRDVVKGSVIESGPDMGTSEAPMRNQMKAWLKYMRGNAA